MIRSAFLRTTQDKSRALVKRKCSICKELFEKRSMTHTACSPDCAQEAAKRKREKLDRRTTKLKLQGLKTRSQWMNEVQTVFNRFIRHRDAALPCISCGKFNDVKMNAGHFLSVGARPNLRFHEWNVHKQCEKCNSYLSGNISEYRPNLIAKIGQEKVDALESDHVERKYTIDQLKSLKAFYKEQTKILLAKDQEETARLCGL